ncbi:DUF2070 domain-containing protein [Halobacteriales archaeon SW_7_68_16]|nr:MAG: DUF2070 domain-containing protein [Halobacteriales archaeon SW_7_68_16]
MTATQGDLAGLSRYVFRAPDWKTSLTFSLVLAAVTGVGVFETAYLLSDLWEGVFFIGVPTVAASILTTVVDRRIGGQMTPDRSSLLALTCELAVVAVLVVAGVVTVVTGLQQNFVFDALLVGLASIFAFRLFVLMAVSGHSTLRAVVPASIQTLVAAVLLFVYSGTLRLLTVGGPVASAYLSRPGKAPRALQVVLPGDFVILGALCLIYGAAVYIFVMAIDRPWKRSLGVSVLDFVDGFVGHIAEGTDDLEEFFEEIGEDAIVPVTVAAFRRPGGTEKARFVLPMIHPGPMGEIGGGNLPERVAREADGLAFPPHATAGHDFNLVTEREVDTLIDAADRARDSITFGTEVSESVRARTGDAKVLGQAVGDDLLLVTTYSPEPADDVMYSVGLTAAAEARAAGFNDVLLADAHNCNDGLGGEDLGHVTPGSERSFELIEATKDAATDLADAPTGRLELGVAWDRTDWGPSDGIGPLGARVAVFDVDGQTTAYVLIDGNNMKLGLRDRIVDAIDAVDHVEVMTTDTHVVNQLDSVNQIGDRIDDDRLIALLLDLVDEALADREPVEGGVGSARADVTVFGNDRTETLASHANAIVSLGGALAAVVVLSAISLSTLLFLLT